MKGKKQSRLSRKRWRKPQLEVESQSQCQSQSQPQCEPQPEPQPRYRKALEDFFEEVSQPSSSSGPRCEVHDIYSSSSRGSGQTGGNNAGWETGQTGLPADSGETGGNNAGREEEQLAEERRERGEKEPGVEREDGGLAEEPEVEIEGNSNDQSSDSEEDDENLYTCSVLEQFHIFAHGGIREIVCRTCQFAIHGGKAESHLRRGKNHKLKKLPKGIDAVRKRLLSDLPEHCGSRCPIDQLGKSGNLEEPLVGLKIFDGFHCLLCRSQPDKGYACLTKKSMQEHLREKNPGFSSSANSSTFEKAKLQTIFNRPHIRYFAIDHEMLASDDETDEEQDRSYLLDFGRNAIDQANEEAAQGLDAATEDSRCRDHFLSLTKWHVSLSQISIEDAEESVKAPDSLSPKESLVSDLSKSFLLRAGDIAAQEAS